VLNAFERSFEIRINVLPEFGAIIRPEFCTLELKIDSRLWKCETKRNTKAEILCDGTLVIGEDNRGWNVPTTPSLGVSVPPALLMDRGRVRTIVPLCSEGGERLRARLSFGWRTDICVVNF